MSKLLRADFFRMFRSRAFWTGFIVMVVLSLFYVLVGIVDYKAFPEIYVEINLMDHYIFSLTMFLPIILSAVTATFLGNDYKNGTIRNKLITGHSRVKVYFSELIVSVTTAMIYYILNNAIILSLGIPFLGQPSDSWDIIAVKYLIVACAIIAFCGIFVFFGLIFNSKSNMIVVSITSTIVLFFAGTMISSSLAEPEVYYQPALTVTTETGETQYIEEINEVNSKYVSGTKRKIYEFLDEFLPYNQIKFVSNQTTENHKPIMPVYAGIITVVFSTAGILIFRKKNLK